MRRLGLAGLFLWIAAGPALAHAAGRGFVMLLPTGYVIAGGAAAVLISFMALSVAPAMSVPRAAAGRPLPFIHAGSLICAALLAGLVYIGFAGPRDPVENLLPLSVWTLWWVGFVLLVALFGNLWAVLNPFTGIHALVMGERVPLRYPDWLAYWPAVAVFFAFAWFQLVSASPQDPHGLAGVVTAYLVLTLAAVLLFGPAKWLGRADPFAVFFAQLGAAAPLSREGLRWPGAGLLRLAPLPLSGVLFVLLTLSAISFDGFSNTFLWLSVIGINPLDFPGRTLVTGANTLGLLGCFAVLSAGYLVAVWLGWMWAGRPASYGALAGRLVYSLIPISIAYHFAHYLSDGLVNAQYLLGALNDPFESGADLLGLGDMHVTASFQNTASGTLTIYVAQTASIILGHVVGVAVAHAMAVETGLARARVLRLELPLAGCMVAYTGFGLWLLGAASIS